MSMEVQLRAGLQDLGLALSDVQITAILKYQGLIAKWNKVYNLTAIRDEQDMLHSHLLDSLAVVNPLSQYLESLLDGKARRVLDVGSGAGLPGVILAICLPHVEVSCVDTVGKKAAFIQQAALSLGLPNLKAIHARVETLTSGDWDIVCSRAFASLIDFTSWSKAALNEEGVWMAMKGKHPTEELAALGADVQMFHVEQLKVPGLDADRCLLWLRPTVSTTLTIAAP
jgi:16S rRNA (guanine527-N7)-methyltransferase